MMGRGHFGSIMLAAIIAGCWSVMSGTVLIMGLAALGIGH
jgi:hypothetical protein